jgi:hypothetical protein
MLRVAQVDVYTTHKYSVDKTYNCWMLNLMHRVTRRLKTKLFEIFKFLTNLIIKIHIFHNTTASILIDMFRRFRTTLFQVSNDGIPNTVGCPSW